MALRYALGGMLVVTLNTAFRLFRLFRLPPLFRPSLEALCLGLDVPARKAAVEQVDNGGEQSTPLDRQCHPGAVSANWLDPMLPDAGETRQDASPLEAALRLDLGH